MSNQDRSDHREIDVDSRVGDPSFVDSGEADRWLGQELQGKKEKKMPARNRHRAAFGFFRVCRRVVALLLLLAFLVIAVLAGAAYFYRNAIRVEVERRLITELERQNIHLGYGSASFDLVRGLLLRDAKLYETSLRQTLLAECSEIGFSFDAIDFAKQDFRGDVTTAFTARNAEVIFYENGEPVAALNNLGATILGTGNGVVIEHFRGRIGELDFDLDGEVRIDREKRREQRKEEPPRDAEEKEKSHKIANFAFFHRLMPWLEVTNQNPESGQRPELRMTFLVDPGQESPVAVQGRFNGQHFIWRGIPLDAAAITFAFAEGDKRLELPDFNLIYGGGIISGEAVWDTGTNQVEVTRFQSSADLVSLVQDASPGEAKFSESYRQSEPALVGATGRLDLKEFWQSDLQIDYRHPSGLTLLMGESELDIQGIHGRIHVVDGGVTTDGLLMSLLNGKVELAGRARMEPGPLFFEGSIDASGIPLQAIVEHLGGDQQLPGVLTLHYEGTAGGEFKDLNGLGNLRIDSGQLYRVPVVGPIQAMMNSVTPMFGDENRGELSSTFAVRDGVLSTDDLVVRSDGTRLQVAGKIDMNTWQTEFEAEGNLVGALGLVTGLLSKALVVEGRGPVTDLEMQLKTVPAEFASETVKSVFGAAGQGVNLVKDGAIKATGDVLGSGAEAVKGVGQKTVDVGQKTVGEGAKMIGQGIMRIIPGNQGERDERDPIEEDPGDEPEEKKERRLLRGLGPVFSDE